MIFMILLLVSIFILSLYLKIKNNEKIDYYHSYKHLPSILKSEEEIDDDEEEEELLEKTYLSNKHKKNVRFKD